MIQLVLDTLEKLKHSMLSKNIIGGPECDPLSRIVKGCGICQQFKINRNPSNPSYNPIPGCTTTRPFANCSMDLITDLDPIELKNGTIIDALMVVVDHGLMKGVVITPCSKTIIEEGAAEILLNQLYKRFRLPNSIISN